MTGFDLAKIRVCFVAGTLGQGGAERQLFYMLKTLRQAGANPELLCLTEGEYWQEPIRALGVPIATVGQKASRAARLSEVAKACRALRPQIVQSQHFYTNLYATLAARSCGARDIGAIRANGIQEVLDNGRWLGWMSLHWPRTIAANSRAAVEFAVKQRKTAEQVFYLPNVIDSRLFAAPTRQPQATLQFLTIGRLEEQKRIDRLLRLLAQARRQMRQPFQLTIAGDGSLRQSLQRQAAELGLESNVEFCGIVTDTAPFYRAADIFLLTSDYEGTPNVVMEAMAAGLPVICTNVGGVPEIMQHEVTGLMFEPENEADFLDVLLTLSNDPAQRERLGNAASRHIETNFSLARLTSSLAALYERALS
jgi:glycosyltransferase involved in cell wall biosynthesis